MDKVQKIREDVEKLKSQLLRGACSSQVAMETMCKEEAYNEVLAILDTMQKEPVSVWHDTTDMPDNEKKILVVGFNGEAYAGYYNGVCNPKKIKHWAYIDELLKL